MNNSKVKQVIIIRKDLNMRKGKMVAQGSHASLMCFSEALSQNIGKTNIKPNAFQLWNDPINGYRKITLGVNSEEELLSLHQKAKDAGLTTFLVKDLGLTEFKEPTFTACAIGPHFDEEIDPITSELKPL